MRKSTVALAALAALGFASPAYADIVVLTGANPTGTTAVTFANQAAASTIFGSTSGMTNNFSVTGTTGLGGNLLVASSGNVLGSGSNATSFTLSQTGGTTFTNIVFNLDAAADGSILFHILEGDNNVFEDTFTVFGTGLNFFTVQAINGQSIQSVTVTGLSGVTFSALNGVSFGPVAAAGAVPEPSTWAMMLLGFGAIGLSMRRKRKVAAPA